MGAPYFIHIIAGARPNFMKVAPVIRELNKHSDTFAYHLIHTGQHYSKEMSDVFFKELGLPSPRHNLEVGSGSHAEQTSGIFTRYEDICRKEKPDLVMVVGDVNSTLACSIVAKKLNTRVAHIEAGLRSGDMAMPEEINRIVTDSITDYFFVTEKAGVENLLKEGKREEVIFLVGNVMIDNLFYQLEKLKDLSATKLYTLALKKEYPEYGVVTLHRPSNVDEEDILNGIIVGLSDVSKRIPLIFPMHPRTKKNMMSFGFTLPDTIRTIDPLSYTEFLNLFKDARLVLTDSGGLQEETTALGLPCITLRGNTERPITITEGTNVLVGTSQEKIVAAAKRVLAQKDGKRAAPELWDGKASERIIQTLETLRSVD